MPSSAILRSGGRLSCVIDANTVLSNQPAPSITADHGGGVVTANAHTEAYHPNNCTVPFFVRAPCFRSLADSLRRLQRLPHLGHVPDMREMRRCVRTAVAPDVEPARVRAAEQGIVGIAGGGQ